MKRFYTSLFILFVLNANAQLGPEITSWIINTTNATGWNSIPSDVQQVQYSTNNVYVSCTCVPSYPVGPWQSNPNQPSNQNFVYKITRNPVQNTSTPVATPLGHTGVWSNGVSIFNAKDGMSYSNQGIWNQNALYYEGISFDSCLGHAAPNGEYHLHVNPRCLYDEADSLNHSPIIGYAFDGFPIYGAYGFTNTNGTGPIKRMQSSFVLSTATTRTNGPAVNTTYPAGCYVEDYIFTSGSGDLDIHNGRFCVTPEYPAGIYAYFITIDDSLNPVYPYTLGTSYYGTVQSGNIGPGSGHNTITETVVTYNPSGVEEIISEINFSVYPNPASGSFAIFIAPYSPNNIAAEIFDATGRKISEIENLQPSVQYLIDVTEWSEGIYYLRLQSGNIFTTQKIAVVK